MSEHSTSTPFIKASSQDQYGKIPLKSWTGKIVSFDSQKDQIESGWGWRYKVRIMGDNSDNDTVDDGDLSYAFVLLPTTAGSGGAFKLRSVRISQGDMVYGVYGGDGPRLILGVFPRTTKTGLSSGKFGTLSGFYGSLKNTGIISGEFNEQIGPATPSTTTLDPKKWTKATANDPSEKVKEIIPEANSGDEILIEQTEKYQPAKGKLIDPLEWEPGTQLNTPTMEAIKNSYEKGELDVEIYKQALRQATIQGLDGYEENVVDEIIKGL